MSKKNNTFYVTTPIYYVNAKPHLGSLYSTLLADVLARWHGLKGEKTFFLTGTDEHGQKVAETAAQAGKQPKEFIDALIPAFTSLWQEYEIKYNRFIRTTDDYHVKAVQQWIIDLQKKGDIYKAAYEGWYCTSSEAFLTEKDLDFKHPDQPPICLISGKPARWVSEECYFFRLSAYQDKLLEFYKQHPDFVTPRERLNEVLAFVQGGLKDLSISRKTITWGIPFPGDSQHVTYVWADALNNYITAIGYNDPARQEEFKTWWPADVQVLGKDILRFHAVYWPAFLMASGLEIPHTLLVHGWIKVDGQKMSKSLGNAVDPHALAQSYGVEPVRYYLTRYMAVTQDSTFSSEDLEAKINSDLVNDCGNLLNRMITLAAAQGLHDVKAPPILKPQEKDLQSAFLEMVAEFDAEMEHCYFHRAYAAVWKYINAVNAYFHAHEPWKLAKNDPERFKEVMWATSYSLYGIALLLWPLMPNTMEKLLEALGKVIKPGNDYRTELLSGTWNLSFQLKKVEPLFKKYELMQKPEDIKPVVGEPDTSITIDDLLKVELLVGEILEVVDLPESEKIYKMKVNFGTRGTRTICAGVKKYYKPEDLVGKKTVFTFNLKSRKLMGIESQGMMMMAKNPSDVPTLILVSDYSVEPGTRLA